MQVKVSNTVQPGHAVALNDNGDVLGIIQLNPGDDLIPVISELLVDQGEEFESIAVDEETIVNNSFDPFTVEGSMVHSNNKKTAFCISITPSSIYQSKK